MPKLFKLKRFEDSTGISGTGYVAEGVEFSNGKVVMCWYGETSTIVFHENINSVIKINCSHSNSKIEWIDWK